MKTLLRFVDNVPLLIAFSSLMWVADGILMRQFPGFSPFTIVFYEYCIAFLLLLPLTYHHILREKPTPKEMAILSILALLSGPLAGWFFIKALMATSVISLSAIFTLQKLQSVFVLGTIWVVAPKKLHRSFWPWATLAVIGGAMIIFHQQILTGSWDPAVAWAGLFAIGAAFAWGVSGPFSFIALKENSHQFVTSSRFALGALFTIIALAFFGPGSLRENLMQPNGMQWIYLIIIGIIAAFVSLTVYFKALKNLPEHPRTFLELLYPLFALLIDITVFNSFPTVIQIAGAVVLLVSTIRINRLHNFTDLDKI